MQLKNTHITNKENSDIKKRSKSPLRSRKKFNNNKSFTSVVTSEVKKTLRITKAPHKWLPQKQRPWKRQSCAAYAAALLCWTRVARSCVITSRNQWENKR
jgi:hypothetical protein